jgi:hypothetical protein
MKGKYQKANLNENLNNDPTPNISLQLVFCFLPLKDLAVVAQCCNKWYKAVTQQAFFNMYQAGEDLFLRFNSDSFSLICKSPFRQALRFLSFDGRQTSLLNLNLITHLSKLNSLELNMHLQLEYTFMLDYSIIFSTFPSSLRKLKIFVTSGMKYKDQTTQFIDALSSLTQIKELYLQELNAKVISDYSFISSLINLEILSITTYPLFYKDSSDSIISSIRSLPQLTEFHSDCPLNHSYQFMESLRKLCAQPGAPTLLKHLPEFNTIKIEDQTECVHLLSQLPSLKHIHYRSVAYHDIPNALGHLIKYLSIEGRRLSEQDIDTLISMPQLIELFIIESEITEKQFERLLSKIGNRLTHLSFNVTNNPQVLLNTVAINCPQIEYLSIDLDGNYIIPFTSYMFQLKICKLLQSLQIRIIGNMCDYEKNSICHKITSILNPPCFIIPSLLKIKIHPVFND